MLSTLGKNTARNRRGGEGGDGDNEDDNDGAQQLHKNKKITLYAYLFATHVMPQKPGNGMLIHGILT